MAKDKKEKKCVACLGSVDGHASEQVEHKDGRKGLVHCNWHCRYRAEKVGWLTR